MWPFPKRVQLPAQDEAARYSTLNPSGASVLFTNSYGSNQESARINSNADAMMCSPIVFAAINKRSSVFSEVALKYRNKATKKLKGGPGLLTLENPWPGGTTRELLARMEQDVSLYGNAYIRRTDTGLERLRPDWVTIISELVTEPSGHQHREVIGYHYNPVLEMDREPDDYLVEDVVHWSPIPDPAGNFVGMSWMTPVLREIQADQGITDYKIRYLQNAATPNLLITYSAQMDSADVVNLQERLAARYGGVDNAFRTMVLDNGASVTPVGSNFKDMEFVNVQANGENRIAIASGVPAIVIGSKEGLNASTYSNYQQALRAFADTTMRPLWGSACAALAKFADVLEGSELWYDTSEVAALREGEKDKAETAQTRAGTLLTLINSGFTPESVTQWAESGDYSKLVHTGLYSVQLQPAGTSTPEPQTTDQSVDSSDVNEQENAA